MSFLSPSASLASPPPILDLPVDPFRIGQDLACRHQDRTPYQWHDHPMLERQRQLESNARSYPRRLPLVLARAQGIYVEDVDGRVFIDCLAGAGTLAVGHNHPAVIGAIQQTLQSGLPLHTLDITTPVKDRFVQDLWSVLPAPFARKARIQFCGPSGSDAVEAALKLARIATGRNGIFAFHGAYHGMTQGALHLMGNLGPKVALGGMPGAVHFLPFPYDLRCPFGLGGEEGVDAGLAYLNNLLSDPESGVEKPAAIILETVQGEGGVIPAPVRWLQGVRELTARHDVLLVIDEVQTGFGRTGRMFSFEHADIVPDIVILSKALGGGLPLAVMLYNDALDVWKPGAHAGTFRGNQLGMAAGSASMHILRDEGLVDAAARLGDRILCGLQEIAGAHDCIAQVRGRGLMLGIEFSDPAVAAKVQAGCLRHGLIVELGGRHGAVVRLLPPLVIEEFEVVEVLNILKRTLAE